MNSFILTTFIIILLTIYSCLPSTSREELWAYDLEQYERVNIDYRIKGNHDTTLLFIHGWNINQSYWDDQVKALEDSFKVVTLDLAGHGNSERSRTLWSAESFARDVINLIERESLSNIILVGHSIGGEIALLVNSMIPEKVVGVIGVDNFKDISFEITDDFKDDFDKYLEKFKGNYIEMADKFARENIRSDNRNVINRIVNDYKKADPKIALAIFNNMVPKYEQDKNLIASLSFPLYIIVSDYAPINEEALHKYAHNGYELVWIEGAGHFPMVEQPQQFLAALQLIIKKIKSPIVPAKKNYPFIN